MHAFLVVSHLPLDVSQTINKIASENKAKQMVINLQKIEDVRELKKLVKFSFAEKTAIVIKNIDEITPEAANAFLKNLEEPNQNVIYVLTANNLSNVLPTIVSRCEIVKVLSTEIQLRHKYKVLSTGINYKDALNIKDRDEAIKFVENYLIYLESILALNPQLTTACQDCLITTRNLKANGNVSLQLTDFVVKMSSTTISK